MNITASSGAVIPDHAPSSYANICQMSQKVQETNNMNVRVQKRDCKARRGQMQQPSKRPLSTVATSNGTQHSHQRRWSIDSSSIVVRKNRKEPQPPERSVSLLRSQASHSSFKSYSCPLIGILTSPSQSSSSSYSSSTSSSCSSPPPVQTSVITGPDPLGWKVQPISGLNSARTRTKRLSLQIPLPVIPDLNPPGSELSPKTKPPLKPKPPRRHQSESSAFLRSLGNPLPVTKPEDLMAVHLRHVVLSDESASLRSLGKPLPATQPGELAAVSLRHVVLSDESDDVFDEETATDSGSKIPPPVPEKTAMARQIAQLIAHSSQRCKATTAISNKSKGIQTRGMAPNPQYTNQNVRHNNIHAAKMTELHLNIGCDRERTTPRFPG